MRNIYEIISEMKDIKASGDYSKFVEFCYGLSKPELEDLLEFAEALVDTSRHLLKGKR